ncbi:MAG: UDP-N-acetylmuramoyl-L-alanyl-D-glutamate--2,6-diaminopimelate ligase [Pseudomonadota bacterium]
MTTSQAPDRAELDLASLLDHAPGVPSVSVRDLVLDSRAVRAGDAFVAVRGLATHGLEHAVDAAERGAVALVWDPADGHAPPRLPPSMTAVPVPGLRARLGELADRFYGAPSACARVYGVTGTNGKTTTAWLVAQACGADGAYVGTLGVGRPGALESTSHTTPDVLAVHRMLKRLCDDGARAIAMEVSSHALDQQRIAGVRIPVAGFTNLSRDHLDYHGTMEAYGAAKERLFAARDVAYAVINVADAHGAAMAARLPAGVELVAVRPVAGGAVPPKAGAFVAGDAARFEAFGLELDGRTHAGPFRLRSPLVGEFNVENLCVALGMLLAGGVALDDAVDALGRAAAPAGRMEGFRLPSGALVVVDYAHTPDALAKALAALRRHCTGRLVCVFGCGGDRDPGTRPQMAAAAEAGSDAIVITDDNPRGEDAERIVTMIRAGLAGRVPARVERDRTRAIRSAAHEARDGDVVLVAGKGHEDYQLYGAERRAHSDRDVARRLTEEAA